MQSLNDEDFILISDLDEIPNLSKVNFISHGDDYQILFTAPKSKNGIIKKISSKLCSRITKIGSIQNNMQKSLIVDHNNVEINLKNKGFFHNF